MTHETPTPRTPPRPLLVPTALAALTVATPIPGASAQDIQLTVRRIDFADGSERVAPDLIRGNNGAVTINAEECADDATITVDVRTFPSGPTRLDVWRDQTANCNDATNRDPSQDLICDFLFNVENAASNMQFDFEVPVGTSSLGSVPGYFDCAGDDDGVYSIYGLATTGTQISGDSEGHGIFTLELDTVPDSAPTGISDREGESSVTVSWDVANVSNLFDFRVYVDTEATSCNDPSSPLIEGDPAPGFDPTATTRSPSTSVSLNISNLGIPLDEERPFVVTSRDLARNESLQSTVGCIRRVPTAGFCDVHESMGGECQGCAVGGSPARGAGLAGGLVLAAAALVWRRKRKA